MREIKNVIKQIVKDLNVFPVNVANKRKPQYPYLTYNILNARTDDNFTGVMSTEEYDERINNVHTTQPNFILSINAYSNNQIEAIDTIDIAWDYFKHKGYDRLAKAGGIVVKQYDIVDRSIILSDNYEFRYGFDVKIRELKEIKNKVHWIEESNVNLEGLDNEI